LPKKENCSVPDVNVPDQEAPFQTHPNYRNAALAKCHQRGFHYANFNANGVHGDCVDCGAPAGSTMVFKDVTKRPAERPVATEVPMGGLGHNPNADYAERMRNRETFNLKEHLAKAPKAPEPAPPVHITRDQVKTLAEAYGLHLVDPEGTSGNALHVSEQLKKLQDENAALLQRAKLAEAAAASAVREMKAKPAESQSAAPPNYPPPAPVTCPECSAVNGHTVKCSRAPWASAPQAEEAPNA
jgi:hypothetical protein